MLTSNYSYKKISKAIKDYYGNIEYCKTYDYLTKEGIICT